MTVEFLLKVLVNIATKCGLELEPAGLTPQKLNSGHNHPVDMVTMEIGELMEVMSYLADTAITLTSFLSVYPPASKVLHELQFCPQLVYYILCLVCLCVWESNLNLFCILVWGGVHMGFSECIDTILNWTELNTESDWENTHGSY